MRDIIITIYLFVFGVFFRLFKLLSLRNKIVIVVSFLENPLFIYNELQSRENIPEIVFLTHKKHFTTLKSRNNSTFIIENKNLLHFFIGIYHLATAKEIVVDNYFGFLSATPFKKQARVTQIWHSVGAIKQFGAMDPTNSNRSKRAKKRFYKVYKSFDYVLTGSKMMGEIFKKAFLINDSQLLPFGVPRTDFFFDIESHKDIKKNLYKNYPNFRDKKIILFAPTFRRYETVSDGLNLDISKLYEPLSKDYILLVKLHPSIAGDIKIDEAFSDFVYNLSSYPNINDLMLITDILVTDYSSLPMEFIFFQKPMIFYADDVQEYMNDNGLWEDYASSVPGGLATNETELIQAIIELEKSDNKLKSYYEKWVTYCDGSSSIRFVDFLLGIEEKR